MRNAAIQQMRARLKRTGNAVIGALVVALLKGLRRTNPKRLVDFAGWTMRTIGPLLPENRIGRDNLRAAFPEKSAAEIQAILRGAWDNLGRVGAEFAHLDRIWDYKSPDQPGHFEISQEILTRFVRLVSGGKPALIFGAHFGNWELPAIAGPAHGLNSTILYRGPNIPAIDRWITQTRSTLMGTLVPTGIDAPIRLADALRQGSHVGMLVDQYLGRGVPVTFFGRPTRANPLLARLARHLGCPICGVHAVRLPGHRFRIELTDEIQPARDADGNVNIAGTMQIITTVIEGWIREHPEQWLWLHRRWRPEDDRPR
jgi:Kdo2-lipid IVA lauroyltransferase/acyltransferase